VADSISADPALLRVVAGDCALAETLSEACVAGFITGFAERAYRRPLSAEDSALLHSFNDGVSPPSQVIRAMLMTVLNGPRFVNHFEVEGSPLADDLLRLDAYEVASRLSYTLWQTMPDETLLAAASDGSLNTEAGLVLQLDRMFADERAHAAIWRFWNEWLGLEGFTGFEFSRPGFQALAAGELVGEDGHDHYADMVQEIQDLTQLFVFEKNAPLADLLTTNLSVTRSPDLARLYGVEPFTGSGEPPTFEAGTRIGLLQRGALLVNALEGTNPFHRGALLKRNLLCTALPQPDPNNLPPGSLELPATTDAQTTRQRYEAKVAGNGLCEGCHALFSSVGYVMEAYDALGRYRTVELVFDEETGEKIAELPIDVSASVTIGSETRQVNNPAELMQAIAASGQVEACMADKYFQYAMRRAPQAATEDKCVTIDLSQKLGDPSLGMAGALKSIAMYSSFFQRKVGPQ
jgi:hypothetical protein